MENSKHMIAVLVLLLGLYHCKGTRTMDDVIKEGEGYVSRLTRMMETAEKLTRNDQGFDSNK